MLKNLLEGQKKVVRVTKICLMTLEGGFSFSAKKGSVLCSSGLVRTVYEVSGNDFVNNFYG
jgi:hypothetical protein